MPAEVQQRAAAAAADTAAAQAAASAAGSRDVSSSTVSPTRMRRVASAPAFKHASCYNEVSPTAAVAAAAAAAQQQPSSSTTATATRARRSSAQLRAPQPCSSCSGGRCSCLEVYVVSRSFSEFAGPVMKRLQPETREHLVDMGICHYMTVFKTADGQLVQFDFGPLGGDVQKAHGPLATFLRRARAAAQKQQLDAATAATAAAAAAAAADSGGSSAVQQQPAGGNSSSSGRGMVHSPSAPSLPMASLDLAAYGGAELFAAEEAAFREYASSSDRPKRGVAGEIRERQLQQLPSACMYMGRTSLSLEDIRRYNAAQGRQTYTLHENDCRHYVNSLVQYTTGVERSTQHLKRHYFHSRHAEKWLWYGWMISAAQLVTDVGNWSNIQAGAAVTLLAVTGRSTLASLKTLATPMLPALKGLPALLPSAGLAAAAAGTAAPAGAAAAAATAGGGSTVIASLATTLKLPATMLLKRPLAAGAAAGSAGAAAAAMRDTSGTAAAAAAAAAGSSSGSSSSSGRGPSRAWSAVGRPLQSIGDGMTHGVRSAVLGIRSLALGNARALQQLHREPLVVPEDTFAAAGAAAAAAAPPRRSFWASRSSSSSSINSSAGAVKPPARKWSSFSGRQNSNQLQLVSQPGGSSSSSSSAGAMAAPTALAAGSGTRQEQGQEQPARRRPLAQLGQNVGRHVFWLGSAAARASGQLALLAFGGSRVAQHAAPVPAAAAAMGAGAMAVGEGPSRGVLVHSSSSHQLRQQQQQQQQQQISVLGLGSDNRSLSLPSLLTAPIDAGGSTAAAAAAAGPQGLSQASPAPVSFSVSSSGRDGSSGSGAGGVAQQLGGGDLAFVWDSSCGGSSSITCSSYGSKSSGVGRQTLNLPAPRISWGKRATQAMIVRQ